MELILDWLHWFLVLIPAVMFALGSIAGIHEFGHYIVSVLCGVTVHEFAIGVGKPLWIRRFGETFYTLRPYPLAAFVKPAGMEDSDDLEYLRIRRIKKGFTGSAELLSLKNHFRNPVTDGSLFICEEKFTIDENITVNGFINQINQNEALQKRGVTAHFNEKWSLFSLEVKEGDEVILNSPEACGDGKVSNFFSEAGFFPDEDDWKMLNGKKFTDKNFLQKQAILIAGPLFNFFLAFALFFLILSINGKQLEDLQVAGIIKDSAAEVAGVKKGDIITHIGGKRVTDRSQGIGMIKQYPGIKVMLSIKRPEKLEDKVTLTDLTIEITPKKIATANGKAVGQIGVQLLGRTYGSIPLKSLTEGVKMAANQTVTLLAMTIEGLMRIFAKRSSEGLSGPVAIVSIIGQTAQSSLWDLLRLVAILSINIGLLNLLPVPALDGGRMLFLFIDQSIWLTGKTIGKEWHIDQKYEEMINFAGILFLLALMAVATFSDLKNIFFR